MARKQQIVPECHQALDQMKYEIAAELGLPVGKQAAGYSDTEFAGELGSIQQASYQEDYWGHISSRDAGAVGGRITQRLVQQAEQQMMNLL